MTIEKIFSWPVLVILNVLIIVVAEITGSLFLDYGIIHIIALFFLLLGISRIFVHYNSFDQYLRPLTLGAVAALLLFSFSHLTEYFSFSATLHYSDQLYVDVTSLYMTAMLLVATAAQYFIAKRDGKYTLFTTSLLALCASAAVTILGFMHILAISIEPDEIDVYIFSGVVVAVTLFCMNRLYRIGKAVSIMKEFAWYIAIAFVLIAASALHYSLYEILEHAGMPEMQIIYVSHFLFYIALSVMFLAFPKLAKLGGLYPKQ